MHKNSMISFHKPENADFRQHFALCLLKTLLYQ
jgi:hypothetical protein